MSKPRNRITRLVLKEISSVDLPAQVGATMSIMKRGTTLVEQIAKSFAAGNAPQSFADVLGEQEREQERWKISDKLWPLYDALRCSISNTVQGTSDLATAMPQIESNVEQFLAAVRAELPEIEQDVTKALVDFALRKSQSPGDQTMSKTVEQLSAELATATANIETLTKSLATANAVASLSAEEVEFCTKSKMTDKDKEEFAKSDKKDRDEKIKKSRDGDESFEYDGQTITKSAVGAGTFAVLKSMRARQDQQEAQLLKAADANLEITLKARITTEFNRLPGDEATKLSVLKAAHKLPEDVRNGLEAMLKAGDAAMAGAFGSSGTSRGSTAAPGGASGTETSSIAKSAEIKLREATDNIMKSRNITKRSEAYATALAEHPELAEQANA